VAQLQRDINRAFESFWNEPFSAMLRRPFSAFDRMDSWFGDFSSSSFSPSIDVADEGKKLKITAELPGMSADDIELHVRENVLTLKGEKKVEESREEEGFYRTERSYGYFQRSIPLPVEVDDEHAEAEFKNGVLTVRLPKTKTEKGRHIEVKSG
jgi:HSP20 family protein